MRRLFALGIAGFLAFVVSCGSNTQPPADSADSGSSNNGGQKTMSSGGKPNGGGTGGATSMGGTGGSAATMCAVGQSICMVPLPGSTVTQAKCFDLKTDNTNCGTCGTVCAASANQTCQSGACACTLPLKACGSACVYTDSDAKNCGSCGNACPTTAPFCMSGSCVAMCATGTAAQGSCTNDNSCPNLLTDPFHCGSCTTQCMGGQACTNGACGCATGLSTCGGACVDLMTSTTNCGGCNKPCGAGLACVAGTCTTETGAGGSAGGTGMGGQAGTGVVMAGTGGMSGAAGGPPIPPERMGCPITPGLVADFEEGGTMPVVVKTEDRTGEWEVFNDGKATNETSTVESSGGTAMCDKYALHVKGSGYNDWGAGFGFSLVGSPMSPTPYNATLHSLTGIRFKAKLGSTADAKSPVRFNVSTPWTESKDNPGGQCTPTTATTTKAAIDCYQHAGKFLYPGSGANQLTQTFQTYTFCFDRDLYPLSLPSNLTTDQRNTIGSNILKIQFQFNQGKDYSGSYPSEGMYPAVTKGAAFDFWIDNVEFFSGDCPNTVPMVSNSSPAKAFPQNAAVGSCMPNANAKVFAAQIATAYQTWTKNFVQSDHIVAPEQSNHVTSEAMGYGMLIAAAMGDKTAFDKFYGYVKGKLGSTGLMNWREDGSGSATDADLDIAYALAMAGKQWSGYDGGSMAQAIHDHDLSGSLVNGGSQFAQANYNPSYFSPAAMRVFSVLSGNVSANYTAVNSNISKGSQRVPTDWAKTDGTPSDAGGADVTSDITDGSNGAMGYDAARVPLRLGLDTCLSGAQGTGLSDMVTFFASQYDMGASIDLMKAGWYKAKAGPHTNAKDVQGSFIGPMGVAGMAAGNTAMRDRAMRAILDIMEDGDFNHTYFPSTVGLISLLIMSGNFPTP